MKTPFSRTRRRNALLTPGSGRILLVVAVVVVILFVLRIFFPGTVAELARPFWGAGEAVTGGAGGIASIFGNKAALVRERDRLAAELRALESAQAISTARIADLERLLGGRTERVPGIPTGVLARPPVSPYDTLVIDRGERDGVTKGQVVTGPGGIPLGTVETVAERTARVVLYSAPGRTTEGWVGVARTPVTLEGASAGAFRTSVPRESTVAVGEEVYIPGGGSLPIGVVVRVDSDPSTPRAVIHVRPRANPFSLTMVQVAP